MTNRALQARLLGTEPLGDVKAIFTFTPFARLPAAIRTAYLARSLVLIPTPASLVFAASNPRDPAAERASLASIALGEKAIKLAEANIEAEQHRLELGKSSTFEVLRRQDELQQARLRHAKAVVDYLSARADLGGLTGAILAQYGIVMR